MLDLLARGGRRAEVRGHEQLVRAVRIMRWHADCWEDAQAKEREERRAEKREGKKRGKEEKKREKEEKK